MYLEFFILVFIFRRKYEELTSGYEAFSHQSETFRMS